MGLFFPKEVSGEFQSFIIAIEFAKTPDDLNKLFQHLNSTLIQKIDIGNYIDFGFMTIYSLLLVLSLLQFSKILNIKFLRFGIVLPLIALAGDFAENIVLLRLTDNYLKAAENSIILANLKLLNIFTWSKWILLSMTFFILYSVFFKMKWYYKNVGIIFLFPLLFFIADTQRTPTTLSIFTNSIFLAFTFLIIYLFIFRPENVK